MVYNSRGKIRVAAFCGTVSSATSASVEWQYLTTHSLIQLLKCPTESNVTVNNMFCLELNSPVNFA